MPIRRCQRFDIYRRYRRRCTWNYSIRIIFTCFSSSFMSSSSPGRDSWWPTITLRFGWCTEQRSAPTTSTSSRSSASSRYRSSATRYVCWRMLFIICIVANDLAVSLLQYQAHVSQLKHQNPLRHLLTITIPTTKARHHQMPNPLPSKMVKTLRLQSKY